MPVSQQISTATTYLARVAVYNGHFTLPRRTLFMFTSSFKLRYVDTSSHSPGCCQVLNGVANVTVQETVRTSPFLLLSLILVSNLSSVILVQPKCND